MTKSNQVAPRRSACPISFSLDLFGDKWTLLVLRDILFFKKTRFSDFAVHEQIATSVLADRLNRLEIAGVITKERDEALKNQNVYRATEKGRNLVPMLSEMMAWGLRYDEQTPAGESFIVRIKKEREEVVKETARAIEAGNFEEYRAREMGVKL
jgi:DNA-binding HxlR family transcriptional regulator